MATINPNEGRELSVDQFLDLVDQAIFELDDLLVCAEDESGIDDDQLLRLLPLYRHLAEALKQFHGEVVAGQHHYAQGQEPAFAELVHKYARHIPFSGLLQQVIHCYKTGYEPSLRPQRRS